MSSLEPPHNTQHLDATWGNRFVPEIQESATVGNDNIVSIGMVLATEKHIAHSENHNNNKVGEFATYLWRLHRAPQRDKTTGYTPSIDTQGSAFHTTYKQAADNCAYLPEFGFQWDATLRHGPTSDTSATHNLSAKNECDIHKALSWLKHECPKDPDDQPDHTIFLFHQGNLALPNFAV